MKSNSLIRILKKSLYLCYQLIFSAKYTITSYLVVIILLAIVTFFGFLILAKSMALMNDSNDSNMKFTGKLYSIVLMLLTTFLTLPIMLSLAEVYICKIFAANSKYECRSSTRYVLCVFSALFIMILLIVHFFYFLFDQYKGANYMCPWKDRRMIVPILKLIKKILLVISQCVVNKRIIGAIMMGLCTLVDIITIGNLVVYEHYYYITIQYVEQLAQIIIIWWDAFVLISLIFNRSLQFMTISPLVIVIWFFTTLFFKERVSSFFKKSFVAQTQSTPSDIQSFSRYILSLIKSIHIKRK